MTFAEIRKFAVAAVGALGVILTQLLATTDGLLPEGWFQTLSIASAVLAAIGVYLVPNSQDPVAKVQSSIDKLGPLLDVIQDRVRREVNARLPLPRVDVNIGGGAGGGQSTFGTPIVHPDPRPVNDPFVVPPPGR